MLKVIIFSSNSSIMRFTKYFIGVLVLLLTNCHSESTSSKDFKPKIAIAGLAIESSTFSPATSDASAFLAREGEAVFDYYPFLDKESPQREAAEWVPTLRGHALPGGIVTRKPTTHWLELL